MVAAVIRGMVALVRFATDIKFRALAEIARLEAEITPRRIREAVTKPTRDVGGKTAAKWLEDQEDLIAIERAKL